MSTTLSTTKTLVPSIILFLIVFGIWQVYDLILLNTSLSDLLIIVITYFVIYAICIAILAVFVKFGKASFKEQGFKEPSKPRRFVLLSISFALVYIIVMLMPGFLFGFGQRRSYGLFDFIFKTSSVILISVTTEAIFRGYIFRNLTKKLGFFTSLYASSIMFSLHGYISPISILNTFFINPSPASDIIQETLFQEILPAFTAGLFLGYMFYKMDWSIVGCTIFRIGTLLFFFFTPITANAPWWMGLTFEVMAYVLLIVIVESAIKEPRHRRRRYGLE